MKKMILNVKINVPDNFECGDCKNCPLSATSTYESYGYIDEKYICKIGYNKTTCPLESELSSFHSPPTITTPKYPYTFPNTVSVYAAPVFMGDNDYVVLTQTEEGD